MAMNIPCKFEKASYNFFFVRAVMVKSLYTLRRRRNKVKSIVSTGGYKYDQYDITLVETLYVVALLQLFIINELYIMSSINPQVEIRKYILCSNIM